MSQFYGDSFPTKVTFNSLKRCFFLCWPCTIGMENISALSLTGLYHISQGVDFISKHLIKSAAPCIVVVHFDELRTQFRAIQPCMPLLAERNSKEFNCKSIWLYCGMTCKLCICFQFPGWWWLWDSFWKVRVCFVLPMECWVRFRPLNPATHLIYTLSNIQLIPGRTFFSLQLWFFSCTCLELPFKLKCWREHAFDWWSIVFPTIKKAKPRKKHACTGMTAQLIIEDTIHFQILLLNRCFPNTFFLSFFLWCTFRKSF